MSRSQHFNSYSPFLETSVCHLTLYTKDQHHQYTVKNANLFADGVYDVTLPKHEVTRFELSAGEILSATVLLIQTHQKIAMPVQVSFTINRLKFESQNSKSYAPETRQLNLKFVFQNLEQRHLVLNYIKKFPQAQIKTGNPRSTSDIKEKRRSPRYALEFNSYCNYHHHTYCFPMQNVSLGGFQVRSEKAFLFPPFSVGEIVEFYFLHEQKKFFFKARLININDLFTHEKNTTTSAAKNGGSKYHFLYFKLYGFRFYEVSTATKEFLKQLIAFAAEQKRSNVHGF